MTRTTKFLILPALFFGLFFIYGCPVDMEFPPDEPGSKPIDEALIGTWTCVNDTCDDLKVVLVEKADDYAYTIQVREHGANYMADDFTFSGYVTEIDGKKFLYAQGDVKGTYFTYHYRVSGNKLSLFDVGLLEGGKDAVTSTDAFRAEISASLKKEGCLSEQLDFVKE